MRKDKKKGNTACFLFVFMTILLNHQWMTEKRLVMVPWAAFTLMV